MRSLILLFCGGVAFSAGLSQSGFRAGADGRPEGWTTWSPRNETMPRTYVDANVGFQSPGSLAISGNSNVAAYGGWERRLDGIEPGNWYAFAAHYRTSAMPYERTQVVARLDWMKADGKRTGLPDYAYKTTPAGEWTKISTQAPAPAHAASVKIQLYLVNAPAGTVWWDAVSLEPLPDPGKREVHIASINLRPERTGSAQQSVTEFIKLVDAKVDRKTDLIVLPEGITVVGTGKTYADVSEPVPGPTTERLGELARRKSAYIVAGIYEREGAVVYNTAVLLDRAGRLAGKYRKVYIPREELDAGITPGSEYPVFRTDFGRIGMMICYDVGFPDPARALALGGAEIIAMPIWGGDETLGKARAIENRVYVAASGYNFPTLIHDPAGETVARAGENGSIAFATVDLNRRFTFPYLGEHRSRIHKESRFDIGADRKPAP